MSILVTFQGTVGRDPELKFTKGGKAFITFSVAHTDRIKQDNAWVDGDTTWIRIVQFGDKAEHLNEVLNKGDNVLVSGDLKMSTFTNKDGVEKSSLECIASSVGVVPKRKREDVPSW